MWAGSHDQHSHHYDDQDDPHQEVDDDDDDDDGDEDPHLYDSSDSEGGVRGKKSLFLNFQTCIFH